MYYFNNSMMLAKLTGSDIVLIVMVIVIAVVALFYFLNRAAYKKMDEQQEMINQAKQYMNIYVIDKKRDKITNINMPAMVMDKIPWYAKYIKMYFVKAKIGPQIMTLMCDKNVFNGIPVKKNIKVELAGIYIVSFAGMKSAEEMKKIRKEKKQKQKEENKKNDRSKETQNKSKKQK